jgi:acyl carrier protein
MTRSSFPERVEWDGILSQPHIAHSVVRRIHAVRKMEEAGAEVFIATADVSDRMNVQSVLSQTLRRFGQLNGVFHLAGDLSHQSLRRPIAKLERRDINTQARPKVGGFNILDGELRDENLDFGVVFSSNSSILGGVGFGAYAPANAILDRLVLATRGSEPFRWVVTNWDGWSLSHEAGDQDELDPFSVTADEGLDALWRIVCLSTSSQVVVSKSILDERLDTWVRQQRVFARGGFGELQAQVEGGQPTEKASLVSRTALERSIVRIWEELLGVDDIGVEGSFLDLGGDSLIALRIIARVRELVGVSVPPSFFVDLGCTVEGLAKKIVTTLVASHDTETLRRHLELTG